MKEKGRRMIREGKDVKVVGKPVSTENSLGCMIHEAGPFEHELKERMRAVKKAFEAR